MSVARIARALSASAVTAGLLLGGTQLVLGQVAQARNSTMTSTVPLNVRQGPGLQYRVVGSLAPGQSVTTTGPSSGGWTPIRHGGRTAFVATPYLRAARPAGISAAASSAVGSASGWTTEALNVRATPGVGSPVLTVLPRGASVQLTGRRDGDWLQVLRQGRTAWVHRAWVSTSPTFATPMARSAGKARATTELMIRTSSEPGFRSLGVIPRGTILDLTGPRANGVAQVLWQGQKRWVNARFLQAVGSRPVPSGSRAARTIGSRYTTTRLAIRPASTGARYLYEVPAGTQLEVTGVVRNGRAEVVVQGASRWVTAMYLSVTEPIPGRALAAVGTGSLDAGGSVGLGGLVPAARTIVGQVRSRYGIQTMYGVRSDPLPDHPSGHAVDVMLPNPRANQQLGWQVARHLQANAAALDVKYVIFQQRIWSAARSNEGWRPMADRGNYTANHYDHVHVTVR